MGTCRAIRVLKAEPVPQELIDPGAVGRDACAEPGNSQGWDFIVVDDAEPKARDRRHDPRSNGRAVASMPRPDRTDAPQSNVTATLIDTLDQAPVLVFVDRAGHLPPAAPHQRFTWSALYPAAPTSCSGAGGWSWACVQDVAPDG